MILKRRTAIHVFTGSAIAVFGVSACGQKGPLFSPEDKLQELERKRDEKLGDDKDKNKTS